MFSLPSLFAISCNNISAINKYNFSKRQSLSFESSVSTKPFGSINERSLPLLKSKSFCSVKGSNNYTDTFSNSNTFSNSIYGSIRRRFERRSWSFRKGSRHSLNMGTPELTIIFSKDALEWDEYLSDCFAQMIDSQPFTIIHERIEDINFPIASHKSKNFSNSRSVLLILSPDFLDFIDAHAEVFELSRLLHPFRTIVMLCGVHHEDISQFHRAALVSYDQWPCLVAKDQDKEFVLSVIQEVLSVIQKHNNGLLSSHPQFKLSPRKVREGNGKVFVLLEKPITATQNVQILFDGSIVKHSIVKWRNPFTLHFVIPERILKVSRVINISILCDDKSIGTRPIKCESKMSELYTLLSSVNSPYDFLCQTFGMETLREIDSQLSKRFKQNLPNSGFDLLKDVDINNDNKKRSDCSIPTLLHFAAQYGLRELTRDLLQCPQALKACQIRNVRGLTPAQLAKQSKHTDISILLDEFQRTDGKINCLYERETNELCDKSSANSKDESICINTNKKLSAAHHKLYDFPFTMTSFKEDSEDDNIYLQMSCLKKKILETNVNQKNNISEMSPIIIQTNNGVSDDKDVVCSHYCHDTENVHHKDDNRNSLSMTCDFNNCQSELNNIIDCFKNGATLGQIEIMFKSWKLRFSKELSGPLPNQLQESLRQMNEFNKQGFSSLKVKSENAKQKFSFNDIQKYLALKLYGKSKDSNLKSLPPINVKHPNLRSENREENDNQSNKSSNTSLHSISSSSCERTISRKSMCDNGNPKADAGDSTTMGMERQCMESNYYKVPISKVQMSHNMKSETDSLENFNSESSDKPPAPPPRPIDLSINEQIEHNHTPKSECHYYRYNININALKDKTMTNEAKHSDKTMKLLSGEVNYVIEEDKDTENKDRTLTSIQHHEYFNVCSSGPTLMNKRDPLTDYDRIPSRTPIPIPIPIPIEPLKGKESFALRKHIEDDYDIPRSVQIPIGKDKSGINNEIEYNNEMAFDDERQIFV